MLVLEEALLGKFDDGGSVREEDNHFLVLLKNANDMYCVRSRGRGGRFGRSPSCGGVGIFKKILRNDRNCKKCR